MVLTCAVIDAAAGAAGRSASVVAAAIITDRSFRWRTIITQMRLGLRVMGQCVRPWIA